VWQQDHASDEQDARECSEVKFITKSHIGHAIWRFDRTYIVFQNRNMVPWAGTDAQYSILIPCTWCMSRKDCRAQRWESCQASLCILVSFVHAVQTCAILESPTFSERNFLADNFAQQWHLERSTEPKHSCSIWDASMMSFCSSCRGQFLEPGTRQVLFPISVFHNYS